MVFGVAKGRSKSIERRCGFDYIGKEVYDDIFDINVEGALNVVRAVRELGV